MERTNTKMPASVMVTLVSSGIYLAVFAFSQVIMYMRGQRPTGIFAFILFAALLVMFARGQRLGRPILIFFIILSLAGVIAAMVVPSLKNGPDLRRILVLLAISAPLITALAGVLQKSAKVYSGYVCPACGSGRLKALDFLYGRAQCKDCGNMWL